MPFFIPPKDNKNDNDYTLYKPISVISSHAIDGRFIPLYLKYTADDLSNYTIKIEQIKYIKENIKYFCFCCLIKQNNRLTEIYLYYFINDHIWKIKK